MKSDLFCQDYFISLIKASTSMHLIWIRVLDQIVRSIQPEPVYDLILTRRLHML